MKTKKGVFILFIVCDELLRTVVESEIIFEINIHVTYPDAKKGMNCSVSSPHNFDPIIPKAITNIPILKTNHKGPIMVLEYLTLISDKAKKIIKSIKKNVFFSSVKKNDSFKCLNICLEIHLI